MSDEQDKDNIETGFQEEQINSHVRLMNRDGSINVKHIHVGLLKKYNLYQTLIRLSEFRFILFILVFYIIVNAIFACLYYWIGLDGIETVRGTPNWWDAFFFSTHTLTTVGFGHLHPSGFWTNMLASFEALIGFLSLSIVTGLIYGRFTNSKAQLLFSKNILLSPIKGEQFLMLRVGNVAVSQLSDMSARLIFSWIERNHKGHKVRRYERLPLEVSEINMFTTSWVIAHKVTENSPMKKHNLQNRKGAEFIVHVSAFDELYDQKISAKTSYILEDLVVGGLFDQMTTYESDSTIVDIEKISDYHIVEETDFQEITFL